ncbi:peptidase associated/transthyretin-like domain-containing protein, partial [Singulisphaera rosea]
TGAVVARLVDANGHPRPNVGLHVHYDRKSNGEESSEEHLNGRIITGRDGRFRIEWLVPGMPYYIEVIPSNGQHADSLITPAPEPTEFHWTIGPGETKDWGDVVETKVPSE